MSENTEGLSGAPVAPQRTCQKKLVAPTVRRGANLLFGARCSEGLAMRLLGAALSNRGNENTHLSLSVLCPNAARSVTVTTKYHGK